MRRALAAGLLLLVAACGGPKEGVVTGKTIIPPMDYIWLQCTSTGKTVICIPIPMHDPECPRLTFQKDGDEGHDCVSREEYDRTNVGDYYRKA